MKDNSMQQQKPIIAEAKPPAKSDDAMTELLRKNLRDTPDRSPEDVKSELIEKRSIKTERANEAQATPEDTRAEILAKEGKLRPDEVTAKEALDAELKKQNQRELDKRLEREEILAAQNANSVDVNKSGKEIDRQELIMPRVLKNNYSELNGKFFEKNSERLVFEDKGDKLATSTSNKQTVADMVTYAKAKQWESIKLSGSQDFRREAWLQAESQGVKTQGYTPKESDFAHLKQLQQERQTNTINPVEKRTKENANEQSNQAPRHEIQKNHANTHAEATKSLTENIQRTQESNKTETLDSKAIARAAYWRGVLMENIKAEPKNTQEEKLANFDKEVENPAFIKKMDENIKSSEPEQTKAAERERSIRPEPQMSL